MFTGLVEACVPVRAVEPKGKGLRLRLPAPSEDWDTAHGDSISVSGCCLTVAGYTSPAGSPLAGPAPGADLVFDLSAETLARTWFEGVEPGRPLNLERSLRMGDRLGGHLVSGHVDGLATLVAVEDSGDGGSLWTVDAGPGFERYLIQKGSVTLDGVSLTVVDPEGPRFRVALIPETLSVTSFGQARAGERLHVEADMVGKWIEKMVGERG